MKKIQTSKSLSIVFVLFLGSFIYAQDKVGALEVNTVDKTEGISESKSAVQTDIISYLGSKAEFSTLITALKVTGLAEKLSGEGPYTIFAPTNTAFNKLGKETLEDLLKPENKEKLKTILKYHVLVGNKDANSILTAIEKGNGRAQFKSVSGQDFTASVKEETVYLMDTKGNAVKVNTTDIQQNNGVIHSIDAVIIPAISEKSSY